MTKPIKAPATKRDSAASKLRLLEAAIDVFSEHGYKATTTRMVAKKAGLNAALISRYFGNKEKMLLAVFEGQKAAFFSEGLPPMQANLEDELISFSKSLFEHVSQNTKVLRIIGGFSFTDARFRETLKKDAITDLNKRIHDRLVLMQEAGKLPFGVKIKPVSKALASYFVGQVLLNHLIFEKPLKEIEAETRAMIHFFTLMGTPPKP